MKGTQMPDEQARERARVAVEDAVYRMLEAGYSADEVKSEVEYALEDVLADDSDG